ncbi:MAG TPA: SDR family oxidoreductase [Pyrinomonadaceae bacterium]|jgi:short-subunit dehydrogenase
MKGPVLILGATSAIARATAASFAARGYSLFLAGRDLAELERLASDLRIRYGTEVRCGHFDAEDYPAHARFLKEARAEMGGLRGVLLAFGYLGDQALALGDERERELIVARNFTGAVSVLEHCAAALEEEGGGFIIGISSVAGDRGRQSNYIYGSAKGALAIYLQGLRNRLARGGVHVMTVKPGFVDTAMTYGMEGLFLVASPRYIGERIVRAVEKGRDIVYLPWFWRYLMLVIRLIPEPAFKRLKL